MTAMGPFDAVAEQRILDALRNGEFDDLPGIGQPLALDDDSMVLPELRMAYRILKNAGFAPPEVMARKEIAEVEALLLAATDPGERSRALVRLDFLRMKLAASRGGENLALEAQYFEKVAERLGGER